MNEGGFLNELIPVPDPCRTLQWDVWSGQRKQLCLSCHQARSRVKESSQKLDLLLLSLERCLKGGTPEGLEHTAGVADPLLGPPKSPQSPPSSCPPVFSIRPAALTGIPSAPVQPAPTSPHHLCPSGGQRGNSSQCSVVPNIVTTESPRNHGCCQNYWSTHMTKNHQKNETEGGED